MCCTNKGFHWNWAIFRAEVNTFSTVFSAERHSQLRLEQHSITHSCCLYKLSQLLHKCGCSNKQSVKLLVFLIITLSFVCSPACMETIIYARVHVSFTQLHVVTTECMIVKSKWMIFVLTYQKYPLMQ